MEVRSREQGNKITELNNVNNIKCKCEKYLYLNQSKGLIYVYDITDLTEFTLGLQENYKIISVESATFIKARSEHTSVFLLTFDKETPPDSIYIPGGRSDTKVHPFINKPKFCKSFQLYGHTASRCNKEQTCGRCSQCEHTSENCTSDPFCHHCRGSHRVGDARCSRAIEAKQIIIFQDRYKVGRRRAKQLYEGNTEANIWTPQFTTHFKCSMAEFMKRKLTPWYLEKQLQLQIGTKPTSIRSMDRKSFIIEVSNEQLSKKMKSINKINDISVNIWEYFQNMTMGLIYVYEYDLNEFDEFRNGLIADYNLKDVQQATWIKPRNPLSKPIILTF